MIKYNGGEMFRVFSMDVVWDLIVKIFNSFLVYLEFDIRILLWNVSYVYVFVIWLKLLYYE